MTKRKLPEPPPLETLSFRKEVVYSLRGEPSLTFDSTCGELVDKLMAICRGEPEFLRADTCCRYQRLLPDFRNLVLPTWKHGSQNYLLSRLDPSKKKELLRENKIREVIVANEPIRNIVGAMEAWVFSYFQDEHHPIMPSYALDLTQFMTKMIMGQSYFGRATEDDFKVERLVEPNNEVSSGFDERFKSEFTRINRLKDVVCHVPPNCSVTLQKQTLFKPDEEFIFGVRRCHLSLGIQDYVHAPCNEPPRRNLQDEFEFFGEITLSEGEHTRRFNSSVPAHWIVASIVHTRVDGESVESRIPVPFV